MQNFDIEKIKKIIDQVELNLRKNEQLRKLYQQTKVPIIYMIGGALVVLMLVIYFCSGLRAITNLVAFVYPAYMSIKAIKSQNKDDDTLWLAYWLWYGLFALVESITDLLFFWIPMYELLKMAFYIFLYAPNVKGALILYQKLIEPWLPQLQAFEQKFVSLKNSIPKNDAQSTTPGAGSDNKKAQ